VESAPQTDNARKKETYAQKRERAIAAAAAVFAEKGYHGATTKDIADQLGIRQGSLYYYFKSKEEALEEVCTAAMRDYVRGMEVATSSDLPFAAKIYQIVFSHLASYRHANEALKVHNDQRLYLPEERRERIKKDGSRYRQMLEELFQRQMADGHLPAATDCQFAAHSVIGLCNAWGGPITRDDSIDLDSLSRKCVQLILQGVAYHSRF